MNYLKLHFLTSAVVALCLGTTIAQEFEPPPPPLEPELKHPVSPPPPAPRMEVASPEEKNLLGPIVDFPDVEAQFTGGSVAMKQWIQENVRYPEEALENSEQGRVYIKFVVEVDGSISNVDVMRGGGTSLDQEAERLVSAMPPWTPAEVQGRFVRARCRLPITFTIATSDEEEPPKKKRMFRW